MVSVSCFGVRVSVKCHCAFGSVLVAEWPPFGKWLPARLAVCSRGILSICNIYLFPVWVLGAGFAFWLHQFLFIAFLLLLCVINESMFCIKNAYSGAEVLSYIYSTKDYSTV